MFNYSNTKLNNKILIAGMNTIHVDIAGCLSLPTELINQLGVYKFELISNYIGGIGGYLLPSLFF